MKIKKLLFIYLLLIAISIVISYLKYVVLDMLSPLLFVVVHFVYGKKYHNYVFFSLWLFAFVISLLYFLFPQIMPNRWLIEFNYFRLILLLIGISFIKDYPFFLTTVQNKILGISGYLIVAAVIITFVNDIIVGNFFK